MRHITQYDDTKIIKNTIEEVIIDELISLLDNLPLFVNKTTIKN